MKGEVLQVGGVHQGGNLGFCFIFAGLIGVGPLFLVVVVPGLNQLLSKSFLLSGLLLRDLWLLLRTFFSVPVGISRLLASSSSHLGSISQNNPKKPKKTPGNSSPCCFLDPKVPSWLAFISTFQSFILFALHIDSVFKCI